MTCEKPTPPCSSSVPSLQHAALAAAAARPLPARRGEARAAVDRLERGGDALLQAVQVVADRCLAGVHGAEYDRSAGRPRSARGLLGRGLRRRGRLARRLRGRLGRRLRRRLLARGGLRRRGRRRGRGGGAAAAAAARARRRPAAGLRGRGRRRGGARPLAAGLRRPKRLVPRSGAAAISTWHSSSVRLAGSRSFGMRALRLPSVRYGPKRPCSTWMLSTP